MVFLQANRFYKLRVRVKETSKHIGFQKIRKKWKKEEKKKTLTMQINKRAMRSLCGK